MDHTKVGERMIAVPRMADLTHAERTVLTVLAYFDGPGGAFPSVDVLAAKCGGVSPSWIRDILRSLVKKGRIRRRRRRNKPSVFVIDYSIPEQREFPRSGISPEQREFRCQNNGNHPPITGSEQEKALARENDMGSESRMRWWCRGCGYDHPGEAEAYCPVCGTEVKPFMFLDPNEYRDGTLYLPFGMQVSGLDSAEARKLFLSDAGQEALRESYGVIFARHEAHAGGRVN